MSFQRPTTPRTSSAVYGLFAARDSRSARRSSRSVSALRPRWSASKRMSRARVRALLRAAKGVRVRSVVDAAEVRPVTGVDLDPGAGLEEERHVDLRAGLERRGLRATGGAVALQAGLGVRDLEDDRRGQLDVERQSLVGGHEGVLVLEEVVGGVADDGLRHVELVVGVGVHEDEVGAVLVEVLHRALVDVARLDLGAGVEGLVDDLPGQDGLELGAHEGGPLAGLHVLELDDGPELSLDVEHHAVLQVVGRSHRHKPLSYAGRSGRAPVGTPDCRAFTVSGGFRTSLAGPPPDRGIAHTRRRPRRCTLTGSPRPATHRAGHDTPASDPGVSPASRCVPLQKGSRVPSPDHGLATELAREQAYLDDAREQLARMRRRAESLDASTASDAISGEV